MKRYTPEERPPGEYGRCCDCGLPYTSPAWADVVVPDDYWEMINPSQFPGSGLLCFNCITTRFGGLGLVNAP